FLFSLINVHRNIFRFHFLLYNHGYLRYLLSFPTRRSSDLAINTARNWQSRQYRQPRTVEPFENEDGETFDQVENLTDISTPESILFSKQVAQTIQDTLKSLPDELRTALELREVEGMTYEEIAQAMGCPIGTVRSRIFRAREAVATALRALREGGAL